MKKLLNLLVFSFLLLSIKAQNIDEVLNKYEENNGGKENFAMTTSIQYTTVFKMNMMGRQMDFSSQVFIETGKLYRKQMAGMFGMKGIYTLITDTGGYVFTPTVQGYGDFPGMEGGTNKMDEQLYNKCKHKMNAISDFGELIDCKSKGFTPELIGKENIDKVECFKIKLTAKDATSKLFWVDTKTYMLKQFELQGQQIIDYFGIYGGPMYGMMQRNASKQKSTITIEEYATVEGIKIPAKQKISFGNNDIEIENTEIKINTPIDNKWYLNSK
jgi:hypothetical protein